MGERGNESVSCRDFAEGNTTTTTATIPRNWLQLNAPIAGYTGTRLDGPTFTV